MCLETIKKKTSVESSKLFKYPCASLIVTESYDSINVLKTSINFGWFVCIALMILQLKFELTSLLVEIHLLYKTLSATAVLLEEWWNKACLLYTSRCV